MMLDLAGIVKAFEAGKRQYHRLMREAVLPFHTEECYGGAEKAGERCGKAAEASRGWAEHNRIACGDNLRYMVYLLRQKHMAGKLQLIYADPPFFSHGKYQASVRLQSGKLGASSFMKLGAYDDTWCGDMGRYLAMLTARLLAMRELLSDTGCLWVHLDWHVAHYAKVILDQIFHADHFINEVIWTYKSGGTNHRSFAKKHDTLLVYGKSKQYHFTPLKEKSYNREMKPYRFQGVEEFEDEKGWYTMVNMKDVWRIDMVGRTSGERTGYATQKPEKLLERIVASCSGEGDLCADFFAGSGTLGAVCEKMNRRWIMCDAGKLAAAEQISRLGKAAASFCVERAEPAGVPSVCAEREKPKKDFSVHVERAESAEGAGITGAFSASPGKARARQSGRTPLAFEASGGKVRLLAYDAEIPDELDKYAQELLRYRGVDSLCFIKCWSVDPAYDGRMHKARMLMTDGHGAYDISGHGVRTCPPASDTGSIAGYDIFGNRFFQVFEW